MDSQTSKASEMHTVAGLVLATALLQQQTPSDSGAKRAARDSAQPLAPVTVLESAHATHRYSSGSSATATRTETPLRDTPQAVSIITSALIAEQSMQSIGDALLYAPGVTMGQGEGNRDQPTIRGQATTADFFVDGTRDDAQYFRDLYNVDRIEVLGGANAMIFGRGGGGGVVNRVLKKAQWAPTRALTLEGGSFAHTRGTLDVGGPLSPSVAGRVSAMSEHSGNFRDGVAMTRVGVSPSAAIALGGGTVARLGAEYFEDHRVADRGLPSFAGAPAPAPLTTFFGNPDSSRSTVVLHGLNASIDHHISPRTTLRAQTRFVRYDKFYQNVFPGAMNATGDSVALSAYNNRHDRANLFAQTELILSRDALSMPHTILVGVEAGREATDNFRNTGYFDSETSLLVPFDAPTVAFPVEFRQKATDADNRVLARSGAVYIQDQVALTHRWQATVGVRAERFDLRFEDHRSPTVLRREDDAISPRAGLVFRAAEPLSVYASYSMSYLPSAGDQFSSLNATTANLEPEGFTNREVGLKWDVSPALTFTAAAYRLDRTNTAASDPLDPSLTVQTGRQRSDGIELAARGRVAPAWDMMVAVTSQRATIESATTRADAGAAVPLVPRTRVSLWNRVALGDGLSLGLGIVHQGDMFAAIDNSVTLPGFWRVDGALYLTHWRGVTAQVNAENLLDRRYYASSNGNNNIQPGAPRTLRFTLATEIGR